MLRTKYKGYKRYNHERKVSGCLQNFDHVTTVHESLGGLEHMERPPRSFERKLDPATLGIQMAHWEWSGLVYQRTWFDVCYICHSLLCSCLTACRHWNLSPWHFLSPLTDWACKWSHSQVWQTGLSLTSGTWGIGLKFKENCYLCMVKIIPNSDSWVSISGSGSYLSPSAVA